MNAGQLIRLLKLVERPKYDNSPATTGVGGIHFIQYGFRNPYSASDRIIPWLGNKITWIEIIVHLERHLVTVWT